MNGAFAVTASGAPGLSPDDVRSRAFVAPSRGVRFAADVDDVPLARASAALVVAADDALLCDVSAARHRGLPLPPWIGLDDEALVGVAVPAGGGRPQRNGVRGRRLLMPVDHVVEHQGLRMTSVARTWVDCAALIPVDHLVAMGDAALHMKLVSERELRRMVTWAHRRRGVVRARQALGLLDGRAESPGESLARVALMLCGIPRPEVNLDIVNRGQWLARVDMAWPEHRVIVEYDGAVHLPESQRRKDALRRNMLQDAGWIVIVFTAADLRHPERMAVMVRSAFARQARSA
jgi:hypothetical protein